MARNSIVLKGLDTSRYGEGRLSVACKPGFLLQLHTDGTYKPHATAGGTFPTGIVAIEDAFLGMTVTGSYGATDLVRFHIIKPGDEVQLVLFAGEVAVIGSKLSSNGDGTVQVAAGTEGVLFEALEALSPVANALIPCRRL